MHFLCLHGTGTNSQVLETQTGIIAPVRYEMDRHHTFEFVEGTMTCPIASDIKPYYPSGGDYYQYFDYGSATSVSQALAQLSTYISEEGPFDGILGFSQGAALAATYLIWFSENHPSAPLPLKCAVFFSGGFILDPKALIEGDLRMLNPKEAGQLLRLPTANIWGRNDSMLPEGSAALCELCEASCRNVYIHEEGHDIPGTRAKEALQGTVRAIRRAIDQALMMQ